MYCFKKLRFIYLLIFVYTFNVISAQTIVKVTKTDNNQLNLLERLDLKLCFEMNDYLVLSVDDISDLKNNKIDFELLTQDNRINPLIIVANDNLKPLEDKAYIGEIVLDSPDLRLEKLYNAKVDLSPRKGIKFIRVRTGKNTYKNIKTILKYDLLSQFSANERNSIINSVNADSIAWFIQNLENFQTRFALHPNRFQVSQWIANQFTRMGYTSVVLDSFLVSEVTFSVWQKNVIAIQEGSDFPNKYIIVGGHHDSINSYDSSMDFAPGADDNASGVAATLEIARVMKLHNYQPRSSLRFVTFAMEELGLYGAFHDADKVTQENLNVAAMINSDMIANSSTDNWAFVIRNYPGADFLKNMALQKGQDLDMQMYTSSQSIQVSDSWAYHSAGIPAVFFAEYEFSPYYHSSNDLLINCNTQYAEQFIKLIASVTMSVSDMPDKPDNYTLIDMGDGQALKASWDNISIDGISYRLTVKNMISNQITEFETLEDTLIINNLTEGTEYQITLYAVLNDLFSVGQIRYATPLNFPSQVTNFTHFPQLNQINFIWSANTEADLQGYKIFKRIEGDDIFTEIVSLPATASSWTDTSTSDRTWYDYIIKAFDNDNNHSDDSAIITTRHISLNSGILLIDLTYNSETNALYPPKDLVDQFYFSILSAYNYEEIKYTNTNQIKIEDLGIYSTLIIHKNSFNTITSPELKETLKTYLDFGGNLLFTANDPLYFSNNVLSGYPKNYNTSDFAYDYFKIQSVVNNNMTRFAKGIPAPGWDNLPLLEVDTTKTMPDTGYKLFKMEAFTGNQYETLYTYESESTNAAQSAFDGMTVAIYTIKNNAKMVITSIPLYFIKQHQAQNFIHSVLTVFEENLSDADVNLPHSLKKNYLKNYPNPFNPETTIQFTLSKQDIVEINIYNVKGQLIKKFEKQTYPGGDNQIIWNGTDNSGKILSSGIYLYQIKTDNGLSEASKMLLLK